MVTDEWRGLGVHRFADTINWRRQDQDNGLLLANPCSDLMDRHVAHHADIVTAKAELGLIYYFTHPAGEPYSHP